MEKNGKDVKKEDSVKKDKKPKKNNNSFLLFSLLLLACSLIYFLTIVRENRKSDDHFEFEGYYFVYHNYYGDDYFERYSSKAKRDDYYIYKEIDTFAYDYYIKKLDLYKENFLRIYIYPNSNYNDQSVFITDHGFSLSMKKLFSFSLIECASLIKDNRKIIFKDNYKGTDRKFLKYVHDNKEFFKQDSTDYLQCLIQEMHIQKNLKNIEGNVKFIVNHPFKDFAQNKLDSLIESKLNNPSYEVNYYDKERGIDFVFIIKENRLIKIKGDDKNIILLYPGIDANISDRGEKYILSLPDFKYYKINGSTVSVNKNKHLENLLPKQYLLSLMKELGKKERLF